MSKENQNHPDSASPDGSDSSAMRAVEAAHSPQTSLEKARNAAEGKDDNASGGTASSTAQEHIPSNSDPEASDLPSSGRPVPD